MDKIIILLKKLKEHGCCGVKISFEDEGASLNDVIIMRQITNIVGLELSVKIGGCEAKRDIIDCIDTIICDSIVAPMIESHFSLQKFLNSLEEYGYNKKKGFNLETKTGYENLNNLEKVFNEIDFVTFGRVDFVNSIEKNRDFVNDLEIYNIIVDTFTRAKQQNIKCYLGGSITMDSKEFINNLISNKLLDCFETRYIIFDSNKVNMIDYDTIINISNHFEVEWLLYKQQKNALLLNKNNSRINMIQKRLMM